MSLMQSFFKWYVARHIRIFRASGGQKMNRMRGMPVALVTAPGRKSGQPRTVPLLYVEADGDYIVCASAGDAPKHPAWYYNLEAAGQATLELPGRKVDAEVVVAEGEERAQLFAKMCAAGKFYAAYQKKAGSRVIPMIRLRPTQG